jgi:hypothetical protein
VLLEDPPSWAKVEAGHNKPVAKTSALTFIVTSQLRARFSLDIAIT